MARHRRRAPTIGPLLDDDGCFRVSWWPARWRNRRPEVALLDVGEVDALLRRALDRATPWASRRCPECRAAYGPEIAEAVVGGG